MRPVFPLAPLTTIRGVAAARAMLACMGKFTHVVETLPAMHKLGCFPWPQAAVLQKFPHYLYDFFVESRNMFKRIIHLSTSDAQFLCELVVLLFQGPDFLICPNPILRRRWQTSHRRLLPRLVNEKCSQFRPWNRSDCTPFRPVFHRWHPLLYKLVNLVHRNPHVCASTWLLLFTTDDLPWWSRSQLDEFAV